MDIEMATCRIQSVSKAIPTSIRPLPERSTRLHLDMARDRAMPSFDNQSSAPQNNRTSTRKAAAVVHRKTSYLLDLALNLLSQAVHCSCVLPVSRLRSTTLKDAGFEGNCAAKLARNSVNRCAANCGQRRQYGSCAKSARDEEGYMGDRCSRAEARAHAESSGQNCCSPRELDKAQPILLRTRKPTSSVPS